MSIAARATALAPPGTSSYIQQATERRAALDVEALYTRFSPMVLRRCRKLLVDEEEALEAMQDVFVQVVRRQDQLELTSPSSFLYTTATRVCLNRLRTARRRPADPSSDLLERIAAAPAQELWSARVVLDRIFARERPSTATIAVLHLLDGMTLAEVAKEVGMSVSGVRKRLRTLKAHVRELEEL